MSRPFRFVVALVLCLALLTVCAWLIVSATTRRWFERDTDLRAALAVSGAERTLIPLWHAGDASALSAQLDDITRDERIMAAAACRTDGATIAATSAYPGAFPCPVVVERRRDSGADTGEVWSVTGTAAGGEVHVSAVPIPAGAAPIGIVVLVHDLSFAARRERTTGFFLLGAFAVLAAGAALLTVFAARISRRGWSRDLRAVLQDAGSSENGRPHPEFAPILQDVRELVDRLAAEREADAQGGEWNPTRLRQTLQRHLHGEKVVIVANREPYIHTRGPDGTLTVLHPASGLVTALEPVMRACSGVWIAHGSGSADRETSDSHGRVRVPPGTEAYVLRRVWLSPEEERGYYYGFANEGLWPLCHTAHTRPIFRGSDYAAYRAINERFADAVCEEVDVEDPVVLVQDYHFALAPRMIRARLPRATIITFWHIPWPNAERFGICPWQDQLLEGLLGSSILGFHTPGHVHNFLDGVDRFLEARVDRADSAVVLRGHQTLVRPYPISVEWPARWLDEVPSVEDCRRSVIEELGLPADVKIGVGVDRLDYTKGVEERLLAVEHLLERVPALRGRFTFVQLAAPSRTTIERYRELEERVTQLAARINDRFAGGGAPAVVLRRAHHEPPTVFRYYRAADVVYVSSLHDGMNLVAKEFVSARDDERGVLVLSHFTGAARELTEALAVNPYDLDEAAAALAAALEMPPGEQRARMRAMRALVAEFNVYRWAGRMLVDAARLRRRERVSGRLSTPDADAPLLVLPPRVAARD